MHMRVNRTTELSSAALNVAFPPRCPSCSDQVEAQGNFCRPCFDTLKLIAKPYCAQCGVPFSFSIGEEAKCPDCLAEPPAYDGLRAVMVYDQVSAPLVSALKFRDQWAGLERYVQMMVAAAGEWAPEAIVPVPLHWRRLWRRRYNQSALLGFGLSKAMKVPCLPQGLKRVRATKPQMRLSRAERQQNVKGAFAVNEKAQQFLRDKTVLLVDDVVTTGATVHVCAEVLKKAGAKEVLVLALARTTKE